MLGMHGTLEANLAMHHADLIVCVGARFDDRITGRLADFCPHARKIHIDIDPASINKVVRVDVRDGGRLPAAGGCLAPGAGGPRPAGRAAGNRGGTASNAGGPRIACAWRRAAMPSCPST